MLLADVREMVHAAAEDQAIDLQRALRTLADGAQAPEVHLALPDDLVLEDPVKAHAVFRCVQEAITNAMRHADARHVWITITQDADGVDVAIRDDGKGVAEVTPGYGLKAMRQRLEAVQGRVEVRAAHGRGFSLQAWVPAARGRS
jgi:signal transduction histidine kinase